MAAVQDRSQTHHFLTFSTKHSGLLVTIMQPTDIVDIPDINIEKKIKDFSELVSKIDSIDDKRRALWKEIYEHAITDRQNAYAMFVKLVQIMQDKSTEFAVHARSASSFIERMEKANDQLLKLADLISAAENKSNNIDSDDMFSRIQKR